MKITLGRGVLVSALLTFAPASAMACPMPALEANVAWCYHGSVHSSMKRNYEDNNHVGLLAAYTKCQKHRADDAWQPGTPMSLVLFEGCNGGHIYEAVKKIYQP